MGKIVTNLKRGLNGTSSLAMVYAYANATAVQDMVDMVVINKLFKAALYHLLYVKNPK